MEIKVIETRPNATATAYLASIKRPRKRYRVDNQGEAVQAASHVAKSHGAAYLVPYARHVFGGMCKAFLISHDLADGLWKVGAVRGAVVTRVNADGTVETVTAELVRSNTRKGN